jgi:cytochrome P450
MQRLKAELLTVMPDPSKLPSLAELEKLQYFKQIYLETLRVTYGIAGRTQRIADEDLSYKGILIPAGTPMSMSSLLLHENPSAFPDPTAFKPERWADAEDERRLSRYLVNFSRGTRMCLGMELAKVEIYLGLAAVVRRFDFELFETDESDVRCVHDFFAPLAKVDSKGVRMFVK